MSSLTGYVIQCGVKNVLGVLSAEHHVAQVASRGKGGDACLNWVLKVEWLPMALGEGKLQANQGDMVTPCVFASQEQEILKPTGEGQRQAQKPSFLDHSFGPRELMSIWGVALFTSCEAGLQLDPHLSL